MLIAGERGEGEFNVVDRVVAFRALHSCDRDVYNIGRYSEVWIVNRFSNDETQRVVSNVNPNHRSFTRHLALWSQHPPSLLLSQPFSTPSKRDDSVLETERGALNRRENAFIPKTSNREFTSKVQRTHCCCKEFLSVRRNGNVLENENFIIINRNVLAREHSSLINWLNQRLSTGGRAKWARSGFDVIIWWHYVGQRSAVAVNTLRWRGEGQKSIRGSAMNNWRREKALPMSFNRGFSLSRSLCAAERMFSSQNFPWMKWENPSDV